MAEAGKPENEEERLAALYSYDLLDRDVDAVFDTIIRVAADVCDAHVNGHIFHVTEGLVSLLSEPEPVKTISKNGKWTVDELARVFPSTIGMELFNPAPSQVREE